MDNEKRRLVSKGKTLVAIMLIMVTSLVSGCEKVEDWLFGDEDEEIVRVNPEYVPIDWDNATLLSSNDSTGNYQIQFEGTVPDIHPGSVLAIDMDTAVHYIFVVTVSVSGNTMNITATEASLTDIFYDTEFTLSTEACGKSKAKGVVFYPVAAYLPDGNGGYSRMDLSGRKDDTRFTQNLWNSTLMNLDGEVLIQGSNYSVTLEKMNASLGVDLVMTMNFGGKTEHEIVADLVDRYRSKVLKMDASLVGRFNTEQMIRFDAEGGFSYTPEYVLMKHNLFRPIPIRFMVGPVPISLTLRSDLFRQMEISGSGEISAYTGFTDQAEGSVGFEWSQTGGIKRIGDFNNNFSFTPPTVEGRGQIQGKVWVFPRIRVMLYDQVGPSFDFMPYMADTVRGGFREQMLGQANDYCAWTLDHHAGLDLRCGLSRNHIFFGYEVSNISTDPWTCADFKLYHSPKKVIHASGRPQGGQQATVYFDVFDTNILFRRAVKTILPQIVKFEASGELSSEYGIAHNGTVSVSWTPNGSDTLWAKLYDIDGNVLAWDTVMVKCDCNLTSGDWVDLGLPSGLLWATRNVGASSPTDYGNFYAWGETTPKSVYLWRNYRYFRCDDDHCGLTKYCNYSDYGYNGFTDNLTILQPGDDAATANYGGRTPTKEECEELCINTTSQWMTINGVHGKCITGSNGNSLFLPAAGIRCDSSLNVVGRQGFYWSCSLNTTHDVAFGCSAWVIGFDSSLIDPRGLVVVPPLRTHRKDGLPVRAVRQN